MKIEIDLLSCKDFGACVQTAPKLFALDDNGKQSLRSNSSGSKINFEAAEEFRGVAEEAAIVCPMQALTILD